MAPLPAVVATQAANEGKNPNILVIMGDDVGRFNIGAYNRGIMSGKTPNLDRLAKEGIQYPPMQAPATINLDAVKRQVEEVLKAHEGQ